VSDRRSRAGDYYLPALGAAVVLSAAIVVIHHDSLRTLISAHGMLHSAIAQQFTSWWPASRPDDPFFAGQPLPYYWFYHWLSAGIGRVLGIHPLLAFEVLTIAGVAIVWLSGAFIGRTLGWRPGAAFAIGAMTFAGANALGGVILAVKLAFGKAWPVDDAQYLWGLTHPVMGMIRFNDSAALYGPLINFFVNNSSRALCLALSLAAAGAIIRYLDRGRWTALAGIIVTLGLCTAFSPIIGLIAAGARIDVARKAYLPRISLSGFFGFESTSLTGLFKSPQSI